MKTNTVLRWTRLRRTLPVAALTLVLATALTGCGDEDSPVAPAAAPAKTTKTVTVTISEVLVIASCENTSTNPGDFTYELVVRDSAVDEADWKVYTGSFSGRDLETDNIDDIVIEMEREPKSRDGFSLVFEVYEWDGGGLYDDRMRGSMGVGDHSWTSSSEWQPGPHTATVSGDERCRVGFIYEVEVK